MWSEVLYRDQTGVSGKTERFNWKPFEVRSNSTVFVSPDKCNCVNVYVITRRAVE